MYFFFCCANFITTLIVQVVGSLLGKQHQEKEVSCKNTQSGKMPFENLIFHSYRKSPNSLAMWWLLVFSMERARTSFTTFSR